MDAVIADVCLRSRLIFDIATLIMYAEYTALVGYLIIKL